MELMDNNPLVCADIVRVPSPAATLALIALGPIMRAGIVAEPPAIIASFPVDEADIAEALTTVGWEQGAMITSGDVDLGTVRGLNVIAAIHAPEDLGEIDEIYEEAYGRSFFVLRDEDSTWAPRIAAGRPEARFCLRITPGSNVSLLTIQTFADINGKLGAGQAVHTLNVMAGFEETLGVVE
jgi:N-acetyl-gamma-glutamylphosphate reductase